MKRNPEHREINPNDPRLQEWEPIFRAAREGRLPNRLQDVLEVSQQLHEAGYHWNDRPTVQEARAWLDKHAKEKNPPA